MSAILIKSPALTIKAGKRAFARIREQGLKPEDVGILPGAAGGRPTDTHEVGAGICSGAGEATPAPTISSLAGTVKR